MLFSDVNACTAIWCMMRCRTANLWFHAFIVVFVWHMLCGRNVSKKVWKGLCLRICHCAKCQRRKSSSILQPAWRTNPFLHYQWPARFLQQEMGWPGRPSDRPGWVIEFLSALQHPEWQHWQASGSWLKTQVSILLHSVSTKKKVKKHCHCEPNLFGGSYQKQLGSSLEGIPQNISFRRPCEPPPSLDRSSDQMQGWWMGMALYRPVWMLGPNWTTTVSAYSRNRFRKRFNEKIRSCEAVCSWKHSLQFLSHRNLGSLQALYFPLRSLTSSWLLCPWAPRQQMLCQSLLRQKSAKQPMKLPSEQRRWHSQKLKLPGLQRRNLKENLKQDQWRSEGEAVAELATDAFLIQARCGSQTARWLKKLGITAARVVDQHVPEHQSSALWILWFGT